VAVRWVSFGTAVPCLVWLLGGCPTPTTRQASGGDRHLKFYEVRDNLVHDHRHLQPLCAGLAAGPGRAGLPRRAAAGRHHRQPARPPWPADHPRRPGILHGFQTGGVPAGRPGRHQEPQLAALLQRQPLLRGPVQDPQVSARVPRPFGSYEDALAFCRRFFCWYNDEHRHSGIGFHTPADVHYGRAEQIRAERAVVLDAAYAAHPERFVTKPPAPPKLPTTAWINQPKEEPLSTANP
jgi:hypothetical protein